MNGHKDALYRLRLAQGFVDEARQDVTLGRWRSGVDNSQLAVENATKAVLALFGPATKTHAPHLLLRAALEHGLPSAVDPFKVQQLLAKSELMGPDIHIQSDYGDEESDKTPWELFGEDDAKRCLQIAEEALSLSRQLVQGRQ